MNHDVENNSQVPMPEPDYVHHWRGPLEPATTLAEAFGDTIAKSGVAGGRLLELLRVVVSTGLRNI